MGGGVFVDSEASVVATASWMGILGVSDFLGREHDVKINNNMAILKKCLMG